MSADPLSTLSRWWDWRCRRYLQESFGPVEAEIRTQITGILFPAAAEPTLPEESLPLAYLHLRLLAGEELGMILRRLERLSALFGGGREKPKIGTLYLMLTALTSTPGRLSSLVRAQGAFFSLLLRRVADCLDRGESEEGIRRELGEMWVIEGGDAASATIKEARGLWRRSHDSGLGLAPLPFDLGEWFGRNGLEDPALSARGLFAGAEEHPHLRATAERLAATEILRAAVEDEAGERRTAWEETRTALLESVAGAMEGLTPWEAENLRPGSPLIASLLSWAARLRLLEEGETPTSHPGRDRLPDWLRAFLESAPAPPAGEGVSACGRFSVGGDTYLVAGVEGTASPEVASMALAGVECEEAERLGLRVRFGDGTERVLSFDLTQGADLLAAIRLTEQPDLRFDLFVHGEDAVWRFGAAVYLVPDPGMRTQWLGRVFEFLNERHGGEEDRIRLAILRDVEEKG
ncbi:MAG: hypothetical protein V3V62_01115 [bacterium]